MAVGGAGSSWAPRASPGCRLLLALAKNAEEAAAVGRQAGGRVFLFLVTDDFGSDHREMKARGVKFLEEPRHESYGTVAVFEDLYGNKMGPAHAPRPGMKRRTLAPFRISICMGARTRTFTHALLPAP